MKNMSNKIKKTIKQYEKMIKNFDGALYIDKKRGFQARSINDKSQEKKIMINTVFSYT